MAKTVGERTDNSGFRMPSVSLVDTNESTVVNNNNNNSSSNNNVAIYKDPQHGEGHLKGA